MSGQGKTFQPIRTTRAPGAQSGRHPPNAKGTTEGQEHLTCCLLSTPPPLPLLRGGRGREGGSSKGRVCPDPTFVWKTLAFTLGRATFCVMPLWFGAQDDGWRKALESVQERLEARIRALEEGRAADQVERADWAERMERLFHRVRMASARANRGQTPADDQAPLLDPPEQLDRSIIFRRKGRV